MAMNNNGPRMQKAFLEGVRLIFKNFKGEAKEFNDAGDRNFGILLEPEVAEAMKADGWPVKYLKPRPDDEDQNEQAWIKAKIKYPDPATGRGPARPPKAFLVTSRGKNELDESMVEMIDYANISNVDVSLNPYQYTVRGESGVTAYVDSIYVTIEEDEFDRKYADVDNA